MKDGGVMQKIGLVYIIKAPPMLLMGSLAFNVERRLLWGPSSR